MNKALALLGGVGIGVGLMYLLDPDRGRGRRAVVKDKALSAVNKTGDALGAKSRDLKNRAQGVMAEASSMMGRNRQQGDQPIH
jgi:hypothetical protein